MDDPFEELCLSPDSLEKYIDESTKEYVEKLIALTVEKLKKMKQNKEETGFKEGEHDESDFPESLCMSPNSLDHYIEQSANNYVDELINRTVKNLEPDTCRSCQEYISTKATNECSQCNKLIDEFVSQTMFKVKRDFCPKCSQPIKEEERFQLNDNYQIKPFNWGTIQEFNVVNGKKKIKDYIKTWEYNIRWLFCIDFLRQEDFQFDSRYRYQVRWSIPTRCKPIPRATASIFFTFVLSKIKPKTYPVEVYFVLETNQLVHRPNESRFREEWLKDIIESKILLISSVNF